MSGQSHSFNQPTPKEELDGLVDVNSKKNDMSKSCHGQMSVTQVLQMKLVQGNKYAEIGIREQVLEKGHQLKQGIKDTLGLNDKGLAERAQEWKQGIEDTLGLAQHDHEENDKGFEYGGGQLPQRANAEEELRGMVDINDLIKNRMNHSHMGQISVDQSLHMKHADAVEGRIRYAEPSFTELVKDKVAGWAESLRETLGLNQHADDTPKEHELGGGRIPPRADPREELKGLIDMNLKHREWGQGLMGQISVEDSLKRKNSDWRNDRRRYEVPGIGDRILEKVSELAEGIKETLGLKEEPAKEHELGGGMIPKRADHTEELRGVVDMKSKCEEMTHRLEGQLPVDVALKNRIDDFRLNRREYQVPGITETIREKGQELKEGIKETGETLMEKAQQWKEGAKEALGMQAEKPAHGKVPLHGIDAGKELKGVNMNIDHKVQQLETQLAHGNESRVE